MQLGKSFHLDVNHFVGTVSTVEDWQKALSANEGVHEDPVAFLMSAKLNPGSEENYGVSMFDYRPFQFDAEKEAARITLREWCERNSVQLN